MKAFTEERSWVYGNPDKFNAFDIFNIIFILLICLIIFIPMWYIFVISTSTYSAYIRTRSI